MESNTKPISTQVYFVLFSFAEFSLFVYFFLFVCYTVKQSQSHKVINLKSGILWCTDFRLMSKTSLSFHTNTMFFFKNHFLVFYHGCLLFLCAFFFHVTLLPRWDMWWISKSHIHICRDGYMVVQSELKQKPHSHVR